MTTTPAPGFDAAMEQFCEQLAVRVADLVMAALAEYDEGKRATPDLLSGQQMADKLGVSRTKLHKLRGEGCPSVKVGDIFKYEPAAVLDWLKTSPRK